MTSIASFRHESSSILKLADDLLLEKSFPRGLSKELDDWWIVLM